MKWVDKLRETKEGRELLKKMIMVVSAVIFIACFLAVGEMSYNDALAIEAALNGTRGVAML